LDLEKNLESLEWRDYSSRDSACNTAGAKRCHDGLGDKASEAIEAIRWTRRGDMSISEDILLSRHDDELSD